MSAIDLRKELKDYTAGWVALDKDYKVVEHAMSFGAICEKVEKFENKDEIKILPAAENYYGYLT